MPRAKKQSISPFPWDKWYPYGAGPFAPLGIGASGGTPLETTFPGEPLRSKVMIALAPDFTLPYQTWGWVDIVRDDEGASLVRWEQQIDITYGGRANSAVAEASLCTFRATNDRRFSRRNPNSPYYNQLSEFTPLWIQLDYGQGFKDKYFGFIHDFAKAWDHRSAPYVNLTARGPLHRIGKSKPLKSPLYRASSGVTAGDIKPLVYWPMEDGAQATQFAAATPGQPNMEIALLGDTVLSSSTAITGSLPLPVFSQGSAARAVVPDYEDTGQWAVASAFYSDDFSDGFPGCPFDILVSGGDVAKITVLVSDLDFILTASDATDTLIDLTDVNFSVTDVTGVPLYIVVTFQEDGTLTADAILATGEITATATLSLGVNMYGVVTDVYPNGSNLTDTNDNNAVYGHYAVYIDPAFTVATDAVENAKALSGFDGERALPRLRRICREEGIPFYQTGMDDDTAQCGPQATGSLIDALRMPEKIDGGVIYEYKFGIGYKSHHEYSNQAVTFTLDSALGQIVSLGSPVDNDLDFVNQWTVNRTGGSSATVAARKGEAGVTLTDEELPYEGSDTVSAYDDAQLESIAARYGRHSTVDEDRWPSVTFHLAKSPELIDSWQAFQFGGRLQALNVYEEVGVTTLDQIHKGHREAWNSLRWEVTLNCAPSSVYNIMELDSELYGRLDSDSSALADDLSDSATSFYVDTTDLTEIWTTDTDEFPLDIRLYPGTGAAIASGGETIRIASIESFAIDTFSRTEVDQWGNMDTGQLWSLFTLGGSSADFDVAAGVGTHLVDAGNEYRVAIMEEAAANFILNPEVAVTFTPVGISNVTGGSIEPGNLILRFVNAITYYLCRIEITTAEAVNISIHKLIDNAGTALSATVTTPIVYTGQALRTHFAASGRTLRAKVYDPADPGSHDWQVEVEDDSLLNAGTVGIRTGVASGNTNVPVTVAYEDFEVYNPQLFTVDERSLNGIVKAHKAGTVVRIKDMVVIL